MLTDVFAPRYANYPIWTQYTENEPGLLVQCFGVATDVLPASASAGDARCCRADQFAARVRPGRSQAGRSRTRESLSGVRIAGLLHAATA